MKRIICVTLLLILFLSGCSVSGERIKDPVHFFYIVNDYQKEMGPVITSEIREASGHRNDLPYLLALYSLGPSQEGLRSPLPKGTRITPTEHTPEGIVLTLTDEAHSLSDADYTLAGACLAKTCMELTDAEKITVACAGRSITISEDNLLLSNTGQQIQSEDNK